MSEQQQNSSNNQNDIQSLQCHVAFAEVIVDISVSNVDKVFDYSCDSTAKPGMRVLVPFGRREIEGYIIGIKDSTDVPYDKIKPIAKYLDEIAVISREMLAIKDHLVNTLGIKIVDAMRLFIPSQMRGGRIKELTRIAISLNSQYSLADIDNIIKKTSKNQIEVFEYMCNKQTSLLSELSKEYSVSAINNLVSRGIFEKKTQKVGRVPYKGLEGSHSVVKLTPLQQNAVDNIVEYSKQCSKLSSSKTVLLHGVTGSGKTEVYMNLIANALSLGKTAIMLVPEISLTPQTLKIFRAKFGDSVAILHSGLSAGERFDEWQRLLTGQALVAVGARSAVFAPLQNIGIIIIDEEHDTSYQSESNPRYNTKDVAQFRATFNNCVCVLGSATPSIETYYCAMQGEYSIVAMPERVNTKPLPKIDIVDMKLEVRRGNNSPFSQQLLQELKECMATPDSKAMLFLNRRGYSSYVICQSCGHVAKCTDCDCSLVYHKEENLLKCHFCQNRFAMLDNCPACKSQHIRRGFSGTEQIVEKLVELFPNTKVLRMDNDTTQNKDSHVNIINEFAQSDARILVGTQMIAKGHDFASVTLVGIIDADMSLHFADYRAVERTYQLVTQVSGRAGRADREGKVVLQTYTPNHYAFMYAFQGDYKGFYGKECNLREVTQYPPFSTIIRVLASSQDESLTQTVLKQVFDQIVEIKKNFENPQQNINNTNNKDQDNKFSKKDNEKILYQKKFCGLQFVQ